MKLPRILSLASVSVFSSIVATGTIHAIREESWYSAAIAGTAFLGAVVAAVIFLFDIPFPGRKRPHSPE